jgi:hypothetical protein
MPNMGVNRKGHHFAKGRMKDKGTSLWAYFILKQKPIREANQKILEKELPSNVLQYVTRYS